MAIPQGPFPRAGEGERSHPEIARANETRPDHPRVVKEFAASEGDGLGSTEDLKHKGAAEAQHVAVVRNLPPVPSNGRIVIYRLDAGDVEKINRVRHQIGGREWNDVHEGDFYPMIVVRAHGASWDSYVNGKVFLDGVDNYWATSVKCYDKAYSSEHRADGTQPCRTFTWPGRV